MTTTTLLPGREEHDTQPVVARQGTTTPNGQFAADAQQHCAVGGTNSGSEANGKTEPDHTPPRSLHDPVLYTLAQYLDDIEGLRKAQGNRLRILTTTEPDEDGMMRGFGYTTDHPIVAVVIAQIAQLDTIEHQVILELQRAMRKHPLAGWQKAHKGIGEKQFARLLAAVGDPYIRGDNGLPRTVSQLWAYCGLHTLPASQPVRDTQRQTAGGDTTSAGSDHVLPDTRHQLVAARRRKGVQSNWSTNAKTRAYLIAEKCMMQRDTEYRALYLARREHTATTHPDWTPGHSNADGLRILSKRILRDVWRASRDHHEEAS